MTLPLLEGLDGVQKMSKSYGNAIGLTESPEEMFGKVMSVSDEMMWRYFELLSFRPLDEIGKLKRDVAGGANPRDTKLMLAEELTARFHDADAARKARETFIARFAKGQVPDDMPEVTLPAPLPMAPLLKAAGLVPSTSEANRMLKQGAVKVDGERVADRERVLDAGTAYVVQVGKRRFARVTVS